MAVTLKDVAALAGVSVKTVSNVVNGYAFVKPENRRRVEEALAATGYRPNVGARNLRRGRTGFLALMVPELNIPYFGELAGLVLTAAQKRGWSVLIEQTQGTRDRERTTLASLGPHLVDGALVHPEALEASDFRGVAGGIPMVMLGEHAIDVPIDRVAIDNVKAARTAVTHLAGLGRRRIAAIGRNPARGTSELRMAGYRSALAAAGLSYVEELVAPAEKYHRAHGAAAMKALLALPAPPDAVFCFNDLLAIGALRSVAELGLRVPEDVAIVGFDNNEESAFSVPALSTVAPDKTALAETAIDLVCRRITGETAAPPQHVLTPFALEVRESTRGR
ncbi:LacI family transcriptional regulator [Amycolatopsis acidiphila]|uniref:LacI family transcriptional regulator n=1 Tax=Amycolatopsis acidiphila TaxID=715473 RepID=A0A558ALV2_9PSEU|nr:LacI family DNA-binding transcriptional regulator [Amycolatopsis acidiphila]TVT25239.1 LacI family transcriptional regulator [Amycolatopsis acidiphila]UIJ62355.1 LacI family transcriptional regulator [Amycolatopsis acidiphila]GHG83224.1 LacI family transcriptional regulator [Amycolatopsis acidiphila]